MKFLLVSRIDSPEALRLAKKIRILLETEGLDFQYEADTGAGLGETGTSVRESDADVVIVIGGDGTILRTIQQMQNQIPLLGINLGEVGFLADLEPSEALDFIKTIPQGFTVEERMRISLYSDGIYLGDALNEALIVTTRPAKMLRFSIIIDKVTTEKFRADGILVSTPTGSTAYAMSAGGPIIDPKVEGFLLVPLAPYLLASRPHIISNRRELKIKLESTKPAHLVIDGQETIDLGISSTIRVEKSQHPAKFVDVKRNFFEKVDNKLRKL